jgi:hyperosmotically inducible protein
MDRRKFLFAAFCCILIIFVLVGCQTTANLTKKQAIEDSKITKQVEAKLQAQPVLGAYPISVDTYDGDVTLTGKVDTENQKERAVIIAKSVTGVKQVYDLLQPFEGVQH